MLWQWWQLAAPIVLLAPAPPAMALNIVAVTTTSDVVNGGDGAVSLREAFTIANTDGDDTQITSRRRRAVSLV